MSDHPLPIDAVLPALRDALLAGPNAVLQATPGAGKTTRVPLALLHEPWLAGRRIVMLEPRRLAARAAAHFMAQQLRETVGETVGYRVRLDSKVGPRTRIEVVTEGVLTRFLQDDPALTDVGLVIFDEFHERSLQADVGLALCVESQGALREDLRLLVMSATLDGAPIAHLLGGAPIVSSEGRSYPVETRYAPPAGRGHPAALAEHAAHTVARVLASESGDVLVFLPGAGEIRRVQRVLQQVSLPADVFIAPLYGDLPQEEQDRAICLAPAGLRKVVLATAIAETSLTIEGIGVVIDAGLMRVPRFDPVSGMTRLDTLRVTKASAEQRRGRAGRLGPGVCVRLWSEGEQAQLADYSRPEILEADLAPLALELAQWGVHDPAQLMWLDPPPLAAYAQARELLQRLCALDGGGAITAHGREMARLAMHPRLAHMVLRGKASGMGVLACELAALLTERDVIKGARDADVRLRLEALHGAGDGQGIDRGACRRVLQTAQQWQRQLKLAQDKQPALDRAGALLAYAYPDRIARRRPGPEHRYRLANGRGAYFAQYELLAAQEFLVAAELDGDAREARIFLAAALNRADIEEHFSEQIREVQFVAWDAREGVVRARRQRRLGELVLDDVPLPHPDGQQVVAALITGIRALGLQCLPWDETLRQWQQRVGFLHRLHPGQWPDVSDQALLDGLEEWLAPYLTGMSRRAHLDNVGLRAALTGIAGWEQQRMLDELAPTHITVPSGSRLPLDYSGEVPMLAVRLQEMFGCRDTPRVAKGEVPVLLHLLSPARRPVQVTRDLAGFWVNTYRDVKKDLKGRYPKHRWPDDPLEAQPTARAKRPGEQG